MSMGWCTIEIDHENLMYAPKKRQMDLRNIRGVGLFATQLPHPRVIYIRYDRAGVLCRRKWARAFLVTRYYWLQ